MTAADLVRRDRFITLAAAVAAVALAWLVLVFGHGSGHGGHGAVILYPASHVAAAGRLAASAAMWFVMMVAMMLPPVLPWILLFGHSRRGHVGDASSGADTMLFTLGYFTVWAAYSVVAAILQGALTELALLDPHHLRTSAALGGAILIAAGLFQLTPLKAACLKHCRSPLSFFLASWRDGPAGAFHMGLTHGRYCVACCWALMAASFALGVMNLLWMAVLTLSLCVEKIAPGGQRWGRLSGPLLVLWGAWLTSR